MEVTIMDYVIFKQWLQDEKNMSVRSATDVVSRCKRINRMIEEDDINDKTGSMLIEMKSYDNMSSSIKSQLKRAITLYLEFSKEAKNYKRNN